MSSKEIMRGRIIRLFPTRSQEQKLWQSAGAARWVWNWAVRLNQDLYEAEGKILFEYDLKKEFTKVRNSGERPWLKDVSRKLADNALLDLGKAYKRFFSALKKGEDAGPPKIKIRGKCTPSFCLESEHVYVKDDGTVHLPMIGKVRYKADCNFVGVRLYNTRVRFVKGKWVLACSVKEAIANEPLETEVKKVIGIDVGVKSLAVAAMMDKSSTPDNKGEITGKPIPKRNFKNINRSHRVRRLERHLKRQQRKLSRKLEANTERYIVKGDKRYPVYKRPLRECKNICKQSAKVRDIYGKLRNIRRDYTHKVTTALVEMKPDVIVVEKLNIRGLLKNRCLAKKIAEQGWFEFRRQIEYKAESRGIKVVLADQWYPSSKTCSCCGYHKKDLQLKDRMYECPQCGMKLDRDLNAAVNLAKLA